MSKLLIGVACTLGLVGYGVYTTSQYAGKQRATEQAEGFLARFGVDVQYVECVKDTDGDGTSSCTYSLKSNPSKLLSLRCDTDIFFNTGCNKKTLELQNNITTDE